MIGVVPARGGSKGVPGKNLQTVQGVPLVVAALQTLTAAGCDPVYVTTDSPGIAAVAAAHGYPNLQRPPELAGDKATIDQTADWLTDQLDGPYLLLQPTVLIEPDTLRGMLDRWDGTSNMTAGYPDRHLTWESVVAPPARRQNRQQGGDWRWREVGARIQHHPGPPEEMFPLDGPVPDIDTHQDLAAARLDTATVVGFRVRANRQVGSGHIRRCLQLADRLGHHPIAFRFTDDTEPWARDMAYQAGYDTGDGPPAVWINDTLDTQAAEIARLRVDGPVVTLEDRGPGALIADRVVNALYPQAGIPGEVHGADWVVLRPEFMGLAPPPFDGRDGVLVSFGGTDPAGLTEWIAGVVPTATIVEPPNRDDSEGVNMAAALQAARVVVCSAGTTLYEAAACGTPAVVIGQNPREAGHAHLGAEFGNLWLGLSRDAGAVHRALDAVGAHWEDLSAAGRRLVDGRGLERVAALVESHC